MFENFVVDIKGTENLILIKTSPGNAHGVASLVDLMKYKEVLGTIAGDDTILVVIDKKQNRVRLEKKFQEFWRGRKILEGGA